MPVAKFEFTDGPHPAPSSELPRYTTYFQLGCGACENTVHFKVNGIGRADDIEAAVAHISPRRSTRQALTRADSNVICPGGGRKCPAEDQIQPTVNLLDMAYNRQ
jgi:hypothetical protein